MTAEEKRRALLAASEAFQRLGDKHSAPPSFGKWLRQNRERYLGFVEDDLRTPILSALLNGRLFQIHDSEYRQHDKTVQWSDMFGSYSKNEGRLQIWCRWENADERAKAVKIGEDWLFLRTSIAEIEGSVGMKFDRE
jgi:hypothetical protein